MALLNTAQHLSTFARFGHYLGTIVATTTAKDNVTTAAAFVIPPGAKLLIQPDAACYVSSQFPAATVAATNSVRFEANDIVTGFMWDDETVLAAKAVSGTVNLLVFSVG